MFSVKRLSLLLAALVAGTMTFGIITSAAWFTDSDSVAVTATSGTIDIEANPLSFTVSNLLPGTWSTPTEVDVVSTAASTTGVKYRITAQNTGGSFDLYDVLEVRYQQFHCPAGPNAGVTTEGDLSSTTRTNEQSTHPNSAGGLPVNWTHCINVQFRLPPLAGNAYQGLSTTFNLNVDATQVDNPGWSQAGT